MCSSFDCERFLRVVLGDISKNEKVKISFRTNGIDIRDLSFPDHKPLSLNFKCEICSDSGPESSARGFLADGEPMEVIFCLNHISSNRAKMQDTIKEILVHELVHAYDHGRQICDLSTCEGLAHSEIKAARAAECQAAGRMLPFGLNEYLRNQCIRKHAIKSTANIFGKEQASRCVGTVFDRAIKDISPFE